MTTWLMFGVLAVSASFSAWAQQGPSTLEQAVAAFDVVDSEITRSELWNKLEVLAEATARELAEREPRRDDPQQRVLAGLAEDHLSVLVDAFGKLESLRYYLRPLVEAEILRNGGPDLTRLESIRLAPGASEDQAWIYLRDIVRATEGQRRISISDPQVAMLRALTAEHMGVLIQSLDMPSLQYYASAAIRDAVTQEHKQLVIDELLRHEQLIVVVQRMNWGEDARDQVILGLRQGVEYTPRVWVQVLAELRDPATYDVLALHLYRTRCSRHYYILIKDLPGIDLDDAVAASWERVHTSPTHARELREVSQIAVAHGHQGALAHLVSLLPAEVAVALPVHSGLTQEVRETILEHIDFNGTDEQIRDWYEANADRLGFSRESGRFYIYGGVN